MSSLRSYRLQSKLLISLRSTIDFFFYPTDSRSAITAIYQNHLPDFPLVQIIQIFFFFFLSKSINQIWVNGLLVELPLADKAPNGSLLLAYIK